MTDRSGVAEEGTVLSVLELQRRQDSRPDQQGGGLETLHTEAAGRGQLPPQLPRQLRYLLLQGLHCESDCRGEYNVVTLFQFGTA